MIPRFSHTLGAVAAAAVLSAGLIIAPSLSFAQTGTTTPPSTTAAPTTNAAPTPHMARTERKTAPDAVEQRIKDLHAKLHITPSEESAWNAVAQAMRDNAQQINTLVRQREQDASSMNAVQDLQSYQKIAEAHSDGMKNLVSSFDTLYNDMSPTQQKTADAVFGHTQKHASTSTKGG